MSAVFHQGTSLLGESSRLMSPLLIGRSLFITKCLRLPCLVGVYIGWKDASNDPENAVTFGDGSPLPAHIIHDCLRILDEESIAIPWQKGDVLLIDNLAVLHSRRTFDPPRHVLAALFK